METRIDNHTTDREKATARYENVRSKNDSDWISVHASGTLRKAKSLGFAWKSLYHEERTCHEWGWEFRIVPRSRVTFGDALIEGDTHPLTEACWHMERYSVINPFPDSDQFETKYIYVTEDDGKVREGVGIILRATSACWPPTGHLVFAIVAEFDVIGSRWLPARNPF